MFRENSETIALSPQAKEKKRKEDEVNSDDSLDHWAGKRSLLHLHAPKRLEFLIVQILDSASPNDLFIVKHDRFHRVPPRLVGSVLLCALAHCCADGAVEDEALEEHAV